MHAASTGLTADSINSTLRSLNLATLNSAQLRFATQNFSTDAIRQALEQAPTNDQWRAWLRDLIAKIHEAVPPTSQSALPPPQARAPTTPARTPTPLPNVDLLSGINGILSSIQERSITVREVRQLAEDHDTATLHRAIQEAPTNPRAVEFLRNAVRALTGRPESNAPARPDPDSDPRDQEPETAQDRRRDQHVAYGKSTAVCFCIADLAEDSRERSGYDRTIMLKAAEAKDRQDCKKGIAWNAAICVNLSSHEVQFIAAVFLNMLETVRFAGHGHNHEKWFEVGRVTDPRFQGAIRVAVAEGKGKSPISVNVSPNDIGAILSRFLRVAVHQLRLDEHPNLLIPTIRASVDLYQEAKSRQQATQNSR